MRRNFWLEPIARKDLQQILRYIGLDNMTASEKMRELFYDAFRKLGDNPHIGHERGDLTGKPVRFWPVHRSYMIVYDAQTNPVIILRIYNGARDIASVLH